MFRKFLYGRYGNDQFNLALIVLSLVVGFVSMFVSGIAGTVLWFVQLSLIGYWLFRALSRSFYMRRRENQWFLRIFAKFKPFFKAIGGFFSRMADRKHKYFKCPNCKARLRVPRGRGEITVTCPRCRNRFDKKS
ncbi:MAG: hypothetical protein IJO64_04380 [Clostridia bacterium]|nr:hypothetical protein [Clostridia bacterium]